MYWGKIFAIVAISALLAGCAGSPTAKTTPTPTETSLVKSQTGDPEADRLITIIRASCKLAQTNGMSVYEPNRKETIYSFAPEAGEQQNDYLNQLTLSKGKYGIGGWPDGDPLCLASMYAERLVPKGSSKNEQGVVFDYVLKKIDDSTYDLGMFQQSPTRSFIRFYVQGSLVSSMKWDNGLVFEITYGPLDRKMRDIRQKVLVAGGLQYLPVGQKVSGMTLSEAKVYLRNHGLTLLVGGKDGEYFYPSGPPGGKSDPKRMIVNIMDDKIVGVWTM